MSFARWGLGVGWTNREGVYQPFNDPRHVGILEQQFNLENGPTRHICDQVIGHLKALDIPSLWFVTDMTGTGEGAHSIIGTEYANAGPIMGIMYGSAATELKIMDEDAKKANDTCADLITEMYYATAMWLEHRYLFIAPGVASIDLKRELCTRRYAIVGKPPKRKIESKDEYRARGNPSPDCSDSLVQITQLLRTRGPFRPELVPSEKRSEPPIIQSSIVDTISWMSMKDD